MQTVALIDYGSGNLPSAHKALLVAASDLAKPPKIQATADPKLIAGADRIVLPGVGAFSACMAALDSLSGVLEALDRAVRERGAPFLGICVGMQLMAERGLEFGEASGLAWISGEVRRLTPPSSRFKIPHMGWNTLDGELDQALFAGLPAGTHMYFTHSFAFFAADLGDVAAWTTHGETFPAAVRRDNLAGVQFHPEKSQGAGGRVLGNFLVWRP